MPLRKFKCPLCGHERETLKKSIPRCNHNQEEEGEPIPLTDMELVLKAPDTKMLETTDASTNKKRVKGLNKTLKARARTHARDHEADEVIQKNRDNQLTGTQLLNKNGERRRKVDDI